MADAIYYRLFRNRPGRFVATPLFLCGAYSDASFNGAELVLRLLHFFVSFDPPIATGSTLYYDKIVILEIITDAHRFSYLPCPHADAAS